MRKKQILVWATGIQKRFSFMSGKLIQVFLYPATDSCVSRLLVFGGKVMISIYHRLRSNPFTEGREEGVGVTNPISQPQLLLNPISQLPNPIPNAEHNLPCDGQLCLNTSVF